MIFIFKKKFAEVLLSKFLFHQEKGTGEHFPHTFSINNTDYALVGRYVANKAHHIAGVTVLVVVPGNQLNESTIQCNTGFSIEDR